MANTNPWKARLTRHAKRRPAPIDQLQARAYGVLMLAYESVATLDPEQRRKNILAYFRGLTAFVKLRETLELEARLSAIETMLQQRRNGHETLGGHPLPPGKARP